MHSVAFSQVERVKRTSTSPKRHPRHEREHANHTSNPPRYLPPPSQADDMNQLPQSPRTQPKEATQHTTFRSGKVGPQAPLSRLFIYTTTSGSGRSRGASVVTSEKGASPVVNRAAHNPSPPPIRTLPAVTTAIAADHQAEPSALLTPNTINRPTNTHTEPNTNENSQPARASAPLPSLRPTADAPVRHRPHALMPVAAVAVDACARATHVGSEAATP